jgi:hypothetical protein
VYVLWMLCSSRAKYLGTRRELLLSVDFVNHCIFVAVWHFVQNVCPEGVKYERV